MAILLIRESILLVVLPIQEDILRAEILPILEDILQVVILLILVLGCTLQVALLAILRVVLATLPVHSLPCTRLVTLPPPTRASQPILPLSRGRR